MIKQRLWQLSLSMTSSYGSADDLEVLCSDQHFWKKVELGEATFSPELLYGMPAAQGVRRASQKEGIRIYLRDDFEIPDKIQLYKKLDQLESDIVDISLFDDKRRMISAMPLRERDRMLEGITDEEAASSASVSIVAQYDLTLPPAGIRGYHIANYVLLCRLGAFLDYLTEEEVFERLKLSSSLARQYFTSFEQFALSCAVGALFCSGKDFEEGILRNLYSSLYHPYSYWKNLDWDLDLQH
ncbi:DUF1266 domain-containing protein [Paenibacillus sp. Leaf72]|uniref:DUF1266 domain-containing protein n=1 Tax=Paenibacillus sp. Leaf72 TaxID=1736234 RepID=UPI0006F28FAB|nr:DUF1266 domain-containing protein [Paenibacillus sp. Leaf72]KQO17183.1 hypothetical protein ASF12_00290 [Paenibacillus sp. Leaf72]